jgi:hypothetical protein
MNYIICLILVVIPLILLFLCNKRLIRDQCKYSLTCIAEEMRANMFDNMFSKKEKFYQSQNMSDEEGNVDGEVVEGFFNGLTSFLSGSTPAPASATAPAAGGGRRKATLKSKKSKKRRKSKTSRKH